MRQQRALSYLAAAVLLASAASAQLDCSSQSEDNDYAGNFDFTQYHDYDTVMSYVTYLVENSGKASFETLGATYEGKDVNVVKVCGGEECGDNYGMWIDAGMRGNEWGSVAGAVYFLQELLENGDYAGLTTGLDWYVLVSANPDGYEYSQSEPNPDWRKNRAPNNMDTTNFGADLRANWAVHWGEDVDAIDDPSSQDFPGDYAFSERENEYIAQFLLRELGEDTVGYVVFYATLGSNPDLAASRLMLPYGYTDVKNRTQPDWDLMNAAAEAMFEVQQTTYETGRVIDVMGTTNGLPSDWAVNTGYTEYSYYMEQLVSENNPTPDEICANAMEVLFFLDTAAEYVSGELGQADGASSVAAASAAALLALAVVASNLL